MHIAPITPAVCMFDNHPNNHDDKKPNIKRIVFFFQPIINKPFMKEWSTVEVSCPIADVPETAAFEWVGVRGATKFPPNAFAAAAAAIAAAAICCLSEVNVKCALFCDPLNRSSAFDTATVDGILVASCVLVKFANKGVPIPVFADADDGILKI